MTVYICAYYWNYGKKSQDDLYQKYSTSDCMKSHIQARYVFEATDYLSSGNIIQ